MRKQRATKLKTSIKQIVDTVRLKHRQEDFHIAALEGTDNVIFETPQEIEGIHGEQLFLHHISSYEDKKIYKRKAKTTRQIIEYAELYKSVRKKLRDFTRNNDFDDHHCK